jgi:hypothetical protein
MESPMRFAYVVRSFVSGAVVYVVAAACGASERVADVAGDGGGAMVDALVDGIVDPVKEASADPTGADIAEERCDKTGTVGGATYAYAVHAYPGKSVRELSALRVVTFAGSKSAPIVINGASFDRGQASAALRDGEAAVFCGPTGAPSYESVTFILPR